MTSTESAPGRRAEMVRGVHHHSSLAGSNLHMTASVFQAWETVNYAGLQAARRLMSSSERERFCRRYACQTARKRSRAAIGRTFARGSTSLQELCFAKADLAGKQAMLEVLPEEVAVECLRKQHAARVLDNFFRCISIAHRSASSGPETHLLLLGSKSKGKGGASGSPPGGNKDKAVAVTRTIWEPAKLSLRMFYRLVCVGSGGPILLRKESRWDEMRHALYCLWLINPAILTLLTAVFIVGDLGIPFVKNKLKRLLVWLVRMLPKRFSSHRSKGKKALHDAGETN